MAPSSVDMDQEPETIDLGPPVVLEVNGRKVEAPNPVYVQKVKEVVGI